MKGILAPLGSAIHAAFFSGPLRPAFCSASRILHASLPESAIRPRRGVAGPMLIIAGIAGIIAASIVSLLFLKELSATFLFLFTSMPKFDALGAAGSENSLFDMYLDFRSISFYVLSVAIIVAGLSFGMESANIVPPKIGSKILANGILFMIIVMVFPYFWDMIADIVQWTALWILNPADPTRAHDTVEQLLQYMSPGQYPQADYVRLFGGTTTDLASSAFASIIDFVVPGTNEDDPVQDIGNSFQGAITAILTEILLFAFKAMALLTMAMSAFLLGTVRYVLTGLLAVAVPLILMLSLIPQFGKVTALMRDTLIALTIVPVFSALAISAGVAVLSDVESEDFGTVDVIITGSDVGAAPCAEAEEDGGSGCDQPALVPPPSIQELTHGMRKFFMALAILALAIYFPAMLAPMISRILSSIQHQVSSTGVAGTVMLAGVQSGVRTAVPTVQRGIDLGRRAYRRAYNQVVFKGDPYSLDRRASPAARISPHASLHPDIDPESWELARQYFETRSRPKLALVKLMRALHIPVKPTRSESFVKSFPPLAKPYPPPAQPSDSTPAGKDDAYSTDRDNAADDAGGTGGAEPADGDPRRPYEQP